MHLTETCDEDQPSLITNVETCVAADPDHDVTPIIHHHLMNMGYSSGQDFVDQGYMSIDHMISGRQGAAIDMMT